MLKTKIKLEKYENGDIAYLFLPKHPGKGKAGVTAKQIPLYSVIANYQGPEVFLDFDKDGVMIGIEFLLD